MNTVLCNLSIMDTIGTQLTVQCGEVSLIQRQICTQLYVVMRADSRWSAVLYSECPYRKVPLCTA